MRADRMEETLVPLTQESFAQSLDALISSDKRLEAIYARLGPPHFWTREPGFPTLLHIILEQQVSLASALAAFRRVGELVSPLTPEAFLRLNDDELRGAGFSRQKSEYGRELSRALLEHRLDLAALHGYQDDLVRAALTRIKGIGPWTADIYLLMALRRPDVWPVGDLALATAVQDVLGLPARPTPAELELLGEPWQPWRAVAARLFWHYYLNMDRINGHSHGPPSDVNSVIK